MNNKYSNESIEEMLRNETSNITPNLLSQIKLKAQYINKEETATVNEEKEIPVQSTKKFNFNKFFSPFKIAISLVIAIALVVTIAGVNVYGKVVEKVTLDVNPSIELSINKLNRVIEVNYNNEDAKVLFENVDFKNVKLEDAVNTCYESFYNAGYLSDPETNGIIISVENADGKTEEKSDDIAEKVSEVSEYIEKKCKEHGITIVVEGNLVTDDVKEFAEQFDISVGEVKVIADILAEETDKTVEELVDMTMKELKKYLNELRKEDNQTSEEESSGDSTTDSTTDITDDLQKYLDDIQKALDEGKSYGEIIKEEAEKNKDVIKDILNNYLNNNKKNNNDKDNDDNGGN